MNALKHYAVMYKFDLQISKLFYKVTKIFFKMLTWVKNESKKFHLYFERKNVYINHRPHTLVIIFSTKTVIKSAHLP